ncbi:hypothetical protein Tco_0876568 [Tanacetum coccineum]|uniref:Reverse transcriptase domain-containing protein n=1 Tax=Tanacetum coccineum TaxID=301880 RepID=A0ABQ5BVM9_9ASTR
MMIPGLWHQLLEAPTAGYEDAIVVPENHPDNFELKHGLLNLVQNKQFFGHDKEDPHAHIRYFNKITSTMKFLNVPSTSVKLMLSLFSLEGAARIWLEKEPLRSIQHWDDTCFEFINKFFPQSKNTIFEMTFTTPGFFEGQIYDSVVQTSCLSAPPIKLQTPQIQGVSKEDFLATYKANDAVKEEHEN